MIRSLDIRRGERWTAGRVAIHMALATHPQSAFPKAPKRLCAPWKVVAWVAILPSIGALSVRAALALLRGI